MSTILDTASPKQAAFIERLVGERGITVSDPAVAGMNARQAIDTLLAMPRVNVAPAATPGYYIADNGDVLVVVLTKDKQRTYAKRLLISGGEGERKSARWEYAPGVGRTLAGIAPLTVAEAGRLGHMHGVCVICAKALTDPASVERGIGPVCAKRLGA